MQNDKGNSSPRIWRVYDDGYVVRNPCIDDIDIIKSWRLDGGHPFPKDLMIIYKILESEAGIYVGEYKNQLVSCYVSIKWGDIYSGSCFYVLPEYRSKGFGWRLKVEVAMSHANTLTMAIDADLSLVHKFEKNGWKAKFKRIRYEGRVDKDNLFKHNVNESCLKIHKAGDIDFEKLMLYDEKIFASTIQSSLRKDFMREITFTNDGSSYVVENKNNEIIGIGYQRPCAQKNLTLIGPIYADNAEVAETLLVNLFNDIPGKDYVAYVYEPNSEANDLFKRYGAKIGNIYQRMYYNQNPNDYKKTVFCYTSPEVCHF